MLNKLTFIFLFCLSTLGALENTVDWEEYYKNKVDANPQKTLLVARKYFEVEEKKSGTAADLGAGSGTDTLFLLKKGWNVLAIDAEPSFMETLLKKVPEEQLPQLEARVSPFSEMTLPDDLELINASFSLPFCSPKDFPECWKKIVDHLAVGGRFAGQLFGDSDEWTSDSSMTFHTKEQLLALFKENFSIEYFQEEEGLLPTAAGPMKHWHVFHVVAKKIR